jgi:hypothetical protein
METSSDRFNPDRSKPDRINPWSPDSLRPAVGHPDRTPADHPSGLPADADRPWPRLIADPRPRTTVTPLITDRPTEIPLSSAPTAVRASRSPHRAQTSSAINSAQMPADRRAAAPRPQSRPLLLKWLRRAPLVVLILLGLGCLGLSWLAVQEILNPGAESQHVALAEKEQEQIASLVLLGGVAVGCVTLSIVLAQQLQRAPRR